MQVLLQCSLFFLLFLNFDLVALTHSVPRSFTGLECGIDRYDESEREACGVKQYVSDRGEPCGAERYNSKADLICLGSDAGGRKVKAQASICRGQQGTCIDFSKTPQTMQGAEDLKLVMPQFIEKWSDFGTQLDGTRWVKSLSNWECTLEAQWNPQFNFASVTCIAKQFLNTCEDKSFGVALWNYCENKAFGVLKYNKCEDPTKPIYKTCEIRKTNSEIETYVQNVEAEIDFQAEQFTSNLGAFLSRIQDKIQMSCLIDRYYDKPQYSAIIEELITKYETNFGEIYEFNSNGDRCLTGSPVALTDLAFRDFKCSKLSPEEVRNGVKNSSDLAEKRFYNNCFAQKAYELPRKWFEFHRDEIGFILEDLEKRKSTLSRKALEELKGRIISAGVVEDKEGESGQ